MLEQLQVVIVKSIVGVIRESMRNQFVVGDFYFKKILYGLMKSVFPLRGIETHFCSS